MDYYTVLNVLPFQSNPGQQLCRSHRSSDAENHKVEASISQQSPVYGNRTFRVLHFNLISDYVCIVFLYFSTFVYILLYLKWEIMSTILLIFHIYQSAHVIHFTNSARLFLSPQHTSEKSPLDTCSRLHWHHPLPAPHK